MLTIAGPQPTTPIVTIAGPQPTPTKACPNGRESSRSVSPPVDRRPYYDSSGLTGWIDLMNMGHQVLRRPINPPKEGGIICGHYVPPYPHLPAGYTYVPHPHHRKSLFESRDMQNIPAPTPFPLAASSSSVAICDQNYIGPDLTASIVQKSVKVTL